MKQKILGVIIDNKLNFKSHINKWIKKNVQKIAALFTATYIIFWDFLMF